MLQEITNLCNQLSHSSLSKSTKSRQLSINQLITLSQDREIDFGLCMPGSVHQRKFVMTMKENQENARIVNINIAYGDEKLEDLAEYVFGMRKQNSYEYFDQFRFKAAQKGNYNFVIGVKTPNFSQQQEINATLLIQVQGFSQNLQVKLRQRILLPFVRCSKQLVDTDDNRLIKLAVIKNKTKRQTKILFRCSQLSNMTLLAQLIGLKDNQPSQVDIKPKIIQPMGKGMFVLSFLTNGSNIVAQKYVVRRILVMKIRQASIMFHFPVQVMFYPAGKHGDNVE